MRLSKEDIALLRILDEAGGSQPGAGWPGANMDAVNHATEVTHGGNDGAIGSASDAAGSAVTVARPDPAVIEAPRLMFEFNLVNRLPSGVLQLTKTGARALFQADCIAALEAAAAGAAPEIAGGVERWLVSSGFLHPALRTVTARGKLWLASLSPEQAVSEPSRAAISEAPGAAAARPPCTDQAAEFAARRSGAGNASG